jgi:hypothetical protein
MTPSSALWWPVDRPAGLCFFLALSALLTFLGLFFWCIEFCSP